MLGLWRRQPLLNPPLPEQMGGDNLLWIPMTAEGVLMILRFQQGSATQWNHIEFTRIGCELGSLLEKPDYTVNIKEAAQNFSEAGVTRIESHTSGAPVEVIWQDGK